MTAPLSAPLVVGFDYTRSLGPVLGRFMAGLRAGRVFGVRGSDGRVLVPPAEYDPVTSAPLTELVEVGQVGTVVAWSWMPEPLAGQPLPHAFAWALILLDGADTPLLHAVDGRVGTGDRVRIRWAAQRVGAITDIACFDAPTSPQADEFSTDIAHHPIVEGGAGRLAKGRPPRVGGGCSTGGGDGENGLAGAESRLVGPGNRGDRLAESRGGDGLAEAGSGGDGLAGAGIVEGEGESAAVESVTVPVRLEVEHSVSPEESRYLRALADGRLIGQRCPKCRKVYIPPRGACPVDGVPTVDEVGLADTGTVTTFCVVNVPFLGQRIQPPYVAAYVLLDGADIAFLHLVLGCDPSDVRMGLRVRTVWKPQEQWGTTLENIDHFAPTGEPDAAYETFAGHL